MYVPWWLWDKRNKEFPRGYHVEIGGGYRMPQLGSFHGVCRRQEGYGAGLKKAIRDQYGCTVSFAGRGEMVPNEFSYCEIDPAVVDRFGIPVLRFHFRWSEHEVRQARHMHETFTSIIDAMGGKVLGLSAPEREASGISVPGNG